MSLELLIRHARVVTCAGPGPGARARLGIIDDGAIGILGGRIAWVGPDHDRPRDAEEECDVRGRIVLPGLVDPHTHLVFGGSRVDELARKMAGEDYRTIAASGGGIASTVRATRAASDAQLFASARTRALAMRSCGTTTVEVKSGYGLRLEDELRLLETARRLDDDGIVNTRRTLLGAHAIPPELRDDRAGYLAEVTDAMVPAAAAAGLAHACDVYLDEGAFSLEEARRVLVAARAHGLGVKAHIGQFADLGGAQLLAELGGLSGDHLEAISDEGLRAMAQAGVRAVLLPGAWTTLRQAAPDARRMRALGVSVAVGTDCNPGTSPTTDLPLCAALAVRDAGLTMEEAVLAVTVEAARALGAPDVGQVAVGMRADLVCYDHDDPRVLAYALGGLRARFVWLAGRRVATTDSDIANTVGTETLDDLNFHGLW